MKRLIYVTTLLLCLGMIPLSCTKPDSTEDGITNTVGKDEKPDGSDDDTPDTGDENTPSESQYVGTWAVLNNDGRAIRIDIIGKDMTLRVYNAVDDNGYEFTDGVVSASLDDFGYDDYVYDVAEDGSVSLGGNDADMQLSLDSDDILSISSNGTVTKAYRVTEFVGKPAPSIIGTWDVVRYYLKNGDGAIEDDSEGEGEYFVFSEAEMSLYFSPDEAPEVYQYTLEGDLISFNDSEGYTTKYQILGLSETDMTLFVDYTEDGDTSGWYYELRKR